MERVKELGWYQRILLLLLAAMALLFAVLCSVTVSKEGFLYKDAILIPQEEDGQTLYTGKIQGEQAAFTVGTDKTVTLRYGDRAYGPYTAKEDPTAVPEGQEHMTGLELRCGGEIIFRGGALKSGKDWHLVNEDGTYAGMDILVTSHDGVTVDANGNVVDPIEPSVFTILKLMDGPEMSHKGSWLAWFCGAFLCLVVAVSILFADELFYFSLSFRIRNAECAEPSDREIVGRYVCWTMLSVVALVIFIMGLQ